MLKAVLPPYAANSMSFMHACDDAMHEEKGGACVAMAQHHLTHPTSPCPSAEVAAYLANKSNTYLKDGCRTSNILKPSLEHPENHLWGKWTWKKRVLKT